MCILGGANHSSILIVESNSRIVKRYFYSSVSGTIQNSQLKPQGPFHFIPNNPYSSYKGSQYAGLHGKYTVTPAPTDSHTQTYHILQEMLSKQDFDKYFSEKYSYYRSHISSTTDHYPNPFPFR